MHKIINFRRKRRGIYPKEIKKVFFFNHHVHFSMLLKNLISFRSRTPKITIYFVKKKYFKLYFELF